MTTTVGERTEIELGSGWSLQESRGRIFGFLMTLTEQQRHYKSDWYYDALVINRLFNVMDDQRVKFWYHTRPWGTSISGISKDGFVDPDFTPSDEHLYEIEVWKDGHRVMLSCTTLF